MLWIAFVLCTFGLIYSFSANLERVCQLWIAFVLCTFGLIYSFQSFPICEPLLWIAFVLCTFGLIYSWLSSPNSDTQLWIAFVLCTFGLIYSLSLMRLISVEVVNCFRSLYLWVDLQLKIPQHHFDTSCELLSFFVPLGWFTAMYAEERTPEELWIAFVLCTFGLIYSGIESTFAKHKLWIAFVLCTFGLIYS